MLKTGAYVDSSCVTLPEKLKRLGRQFKVRTTFKTQNILNKQNLVKTKPRYSNHYSKHFITKPAICCMFQIAFLLNLRFQISKRRIFLLTQNRRNISEILFKHQGQYLQLFQILMILGTFLELDSSVQRFDELQTNATRSTNHFYICYITSIHLVFPSYVI